MTGRGSALFIPIVVAAGAWWAATWVAYGGGVLLGLGVAALLVAVIAILVAQHPHAGFDWVVLAIVLGAGLLGAGVGTANGALLADQGPTLASRPHLSEDPFPLEPPLDGRSHYYTFEPACALSGFVPCGRSEWVTQPGTAKYRAYRLPLPCLYVLPCERVHGPEDAGTYISDRP